MNYLGARLTHLTNPSLLVSSYSTTNSPELNPHISYFQVGTHFRLTTGTLEILWSSTYAFVLMLKATIVPFDVPVRTKSSTISI